MGDLENSGLKGLIFDMDGTIVDTTDLDFKAWEKVFSDYGKAFKYDEYIKILGKRSSEVARSKIDLQGEELEELLQIKMKYFRNYATREGIKKIPGAEGILKKAKDLHLKLAVASGARKDKLEFVLEYTGLINFFEVFITADDVEKGKPDPELFLKASEHLRIAPGNLIVFEDAENGVKAAANAKMKCIAITTTTAVEKISSADLLIDSFEDLDLEKIYRNFPELK